MFKKYDHIAWGIVAQGLVFRYVYHGLVMNKCIFNGPREWTMFFLSLNFSLAH